MNLTRYNNDIVVIGWTYDPIHKVDTLSTAIEQFTDIYYEKDQEYKTNINSCGEELIIYNDYELARKIRLTYEPNHPRKIYGENVDNVFRYLEGSLDSHTHLISLKFDLF
jgi:hypothetical protein